MTKQEELAAIRALSEKLGPDSYIGPWLRDSIPAIESAMAADMPLPTMEEAYNATMEASKSLQRANENYRAAREATEKAAQTLRDAEHQQFIIVERAREEAKKIKQEAGRKAREALAILAA